MYVYFIYYILLLRFVSKFVNNVYKTVYVNNAIRHAQSNLQSSLFRFINCLHTNLYRCDSCTVDEFYDFLANRNEPQKNVIMLSRKQSDAVTIRGFRFSCAPNKKYAICTYSP